MGKDAKGGLSIIYGFGLSLSDKNFIFKCGLIGFGSGIDLFVFVNVNFVLVN